MLRRLVLFVFVLGLLVPATAFGQQQFLGGRPVITRCLSQFAAGAGWRTVTTTRNLVGDDRRQVRVTLRDPSGNDPKVRDQLGSIFSEVTNMPAGDVFTKVYTSQDGTLKVGSLCYEIPVTSWGAPEVEITIDYERLIMGNWTRVSKGWSSDHLKPTDPSREGWFYGQTMTGLAIHNPNDSEVVVWLVRRSTNQNIPVTIPARAQVPKYLGEIMGEFRNGEEAINFSSTLPVVVLPLRSTIDPQDGVEKYVDAPVATPRSN